MALSSSLSDDSRKRVAADLTKTAMASAGCVAKERSSAAKSSTRVGICDDKSRSMRMGEVEIVDLQPEIGVTIC
jgi:hypothetical protein